MDSKQYKLLRLKIMGAITAFSLIPLVALGSFMHLQFSQGYHERIAHSLQRSVENRKAAIDMFLEENILQLRNMAWTHDFEQMSDQAYLQHVFSTMQSGNKAFVDLGVIDGDGRHAAYVGPYELGDVNYRGQDWFEKTMLKGVYVSDVFMGFRQFPHIILAVMRREGNRYWILRATLDSEVLNALVRNYQTGQRGDAFLVNSAHVLQTSSGLNGAVLGKMDQLAGPSRFTGARVEEHSVHGRTVLYGMAWLNNVDWLLVISEAPGESLSPLFRTQAIVISMVGGGLLLIMAGAAIATRSIVEALARTDRHKAELDARIMQSNKMAALGKMAAGVAHEVNNPLTLIRESAGWIKDLLTEEDPEAIKNYEEIAEAVDKIDQNVERAKGVTHRMLGFARRMEPMQENVDLNQVAKQTMAFLQNEALHRNIELRAELAPDLPHTATDTAQFQQVLLNLLENAIDAVDRDGSVTIRTRTEESGKKIQLSVIDTGKGIPKEMQGRIFDPFFTTKGVGEGTGLGLSISYGIMERLGGGIAVESEEGKGATFTLTLPVC
ncbi:MAG: ATP-binding protein [Desulfocurvibacter africanus]